jgi:hypothetical protein
VTKYDSPALLLPDLGLYDAVLIENASLTDAETLILEAYVASGGTAFLSDIVNSESGLALNASFTHESGQANATWTQTDAFLDVFSGLSAEFAHNNSLQGSIHALASSGNRTMAARWKYGNGTVYYLSTFDIPDGHDLVEEAMEQYLFERVITGTINPPVNGSSSTATVSRLVMYSRKPVVMKVMSWR